VAAVVAEDAGAVADELDFTVRHLSLENMRTSANSTITCGAKVRFLSPLAVLALSLVFGHPATSIAADTGKLFASPQEAVAALQAATASADTNALRTILGLASEGLENPDRVQATNELGTFSAALAATNRLVPITDERFVIELGNDFWPFPVPLVKTNGGWFFDTEAGKDELLSRRIGRNELATIPVLRAYVDAQREYAGQDHDTNTVLEYAQRLVSSPGKHDGLYWPPAFPGDESPLGPLVAYAQGEGYSPKPSQADPEAERGPYQGYCFKILTRQGKHAPGGKYDYVINGHMIGGFALVAWPADYGQSGVMTFIVNQQGRVYQKDLGENTAKLVKKMRAYDPDPSWRLSPD
jgi:hypothetical protein